jgi:hypothetical protein
MRPVHQPSAQLRPFRAAAVGRVAVVATAISLALAALSGCGGAQQGPGGPSETLRAYAAALREGRAEEAYGLLSDEAKRSISREAFVRMVKENPADVQDIAQALSRSSSDPVVTAKVQAPGGDVLTLVYEKGAWRVDGSAIDRYGQATPRQALVGFLRAFERSRYDVLIRYVPDREREGRGDAMWGSEASSVQLTAAKLKAEWTGEQKEYISSIVQAIKSALPTAQIEQTEDRAAMPYGAGGTVLFVREGGVWKIEDLK